MQVLRHFLLLLLAFPAPGFAGDRAKVTIPVNIAYAVDSLWTEDEIRRRFESTKSIYKNACQSLEIELELNELLAVTDPELQDIRGHLKEKSVRTFKDILSRFKKQVRPTLLYIRKGPSQIDEDELSDFPAQAFTFDGPRPLAKFKSHNWNGFVFGPNEPFPYIRGNLDWNRYEEFKAIHGVANIGQSYSEKYQGINFSESWPHRVSTDAHELGHILLNDGSHRDPEDNIMGSENRTRLDQDQCELIAAYHEMEALREEAIFGAMREECKEAVKRGLPADTGSCALLNKK